MKARRKSDCRLFGLSGGRGDELCLWEYVRFDDGKVRQVHFWRKASGYDEVSDDAGEVEVVADVRKMSVEARTRHMTDMVRNIAVPRASRVLC